MRGFRVVVIIIPPIHIIKGPEIVVLGFGLGKVFQILLGNGSNRGGSRRCCRSMAALWIHALCFAQAFEAFLIDLVKGRGAKGIKGIIRAVVIITTACCWLLLLLNCE